MPFKKGHKKIGGKRLGSVSVKAKVKRTLDMICEMHNVDPLEAMVLMCKHPDPYLSWPAIKECCQYLIPKKRAIEIDMELGAKTKVDAQGNIQEDPIIVEIRQKFSKAEGV